MTVKLKINKKYLDRRNNIWLVVDKNKDGHNYKNKTGKLLSTLPDRSDRPYWAVLLGYDGVVQEWQSYEEDGTTGKNSGWWELISEVQEITRGTYGQFSKLEEEFSEMTEAYENNDSIALLAEASDFIGALEAFIEQHFPSLTLADILHHSKNKKKLYEEGKLKNRDGTVK